MKLNKFKALLALAVIMILTSITPLAAQTPTYRDVPASHFAHDAISWVSDPTNGAFMVGDAGNNFHPSRGLNKFEAAQVFAMAAGFRHSTDHLADQEREAQVRSFEMWRPFLDSLDERYSRWNRTFDREVAFLLYRGILNLGDVERFIVTTNGQEQISPFTRQEALAWTVRLIGRGAHAQAIVLPYHTPFRDDEYINDNIKRYVYYAKEAGIGIGSNEYLSPLHQFTRAEIAVLLHSQLSDDNTSTQPVVGTTSVATITGTVVSMVADTQININSAAGIENFRFTPNAVVMVNNLQRTPSFLHSGMHVTALLNAQRQILTIVARSEAENENEQQASSAETIALPDTPTNVSGLNTDEGIITAVHQNGVTIRISRVRLNGEIVEEDRNFNIQPTANISRGNATVTLADVQVGDITIFRFNGNNIEYLSLLENASTITGTLTEIHPTTEQPILVVEAANGIPRPLQLTTATTIARGYAASLNWNDLRIGDSITADIEHDRIISLIATGTRTTVEGRLTGIEINENYSRITLTKANNTQQEYILMPGVSDIFALRIGTNLRLMLDSREITSVQTISNPQSTDTSFVGFIQTVCHQTHTMSVVAGQQIFNLSLNAQTTVQRSGARVGAQELMAQMNVFVQLTDSNIAGTVTILP